MLSADGDAMLPVSAKPAERVCVQAGRDGALQLVHCGLPVACGAVRAVQGPGRLRAAQPDLWPARSGPAV